MKRTEESDESPEEAPESKPDQEPNSKVVEPQEDQSDTQTNPDTIAVTDVESENTNAEPLPEPSRKLRRSRVFFVEVDDGGVAQLKSVVRPVYYVDSPLTDTLQSLLQGLSADDVRGGLLSLVPEGTELRGITIRGETAYIDFNESFRFNAFGGEGYKSQLQQIVFTATEFQNVKSVQFLVNGERISYLGPESPYIGEPLSRESL